MKRGFCIVLLWIFVFGRTDAIAHVLWSGVRNIHLGPGNGSTNWSPAWACWDLDVDDDGVDDFRFEQAAMLDLVVYTLDGAQWQSADLDYVAERDRWEVEFDRLTGLFQCFFQVVDQAGNVTVTANKGLYFEPGEWQTYLPIVFRNSP